MSRAHHLVAALIDDEAQGDLSGTPFETLRQAGWSPLRVTMAHKFVVKANMNLPTEMEVFADDLIRRNLFGLPFGEVIFEYECGGDGGDTEPHKSPCGAAAFVTRNTVATPGAPGSPKITWITILGREERHQTEGRFVEFRIVFHSTSGDFILPSSAVVIGKGEEKISLPRDTSFDRWATGTAAYLGKATVVALMSSSVAVAGVEAPSRLNRARLKQRKVPLFSYRTISLPDKAGEAGGQSAAAPDRHSPRLHWRRGHYRFRKSTGRRDVPVAPCLVGNRDAGAVFKDYDVNAGLGRQ